MLRGVFLIYFCVCVFLKDYFQPEYILSVAWVSNGPFSQCTGSPL